LAGDADGLWQHLGFGKVAVLDHCYGGFNALKYTLH
jgi:pimeloyl-ACP methyl ester carboxylesterase